MTQSDFALDKLIIKGNTTGKLTIDELQSHGFHRVKINIWKTFYTK